MTEPTSNFADDCKRYIQLHAKIARMKGRAEILKERIKPHLREGRHSPRDLPYLLVLQKRMRTLSDWKEALKQELSRLWKNEAQAEKRVKEIQSAFPSEETEALCIELNKSYAAKM